MLHDILFKIRMRNSEIFVVFSLINIKKRKSDNMI